MSLNSSVPTTLPTIKPAVSNLNPPHGGVLTNLMAFGEHRTELQLASRDWLSWDLTPRQLCDLELLLNGGFSPLRGFMSAANYRSVCSRMRLADGTIWPMPITLDVTEDFAAKLKPGTRIALRDAEGVMLAALHVSEVWRPDKQEEAQSVFGSVNPEHPGVAYLLNKANPVYVAGEVAGLNMPTHYDFNHLRLTPAELRVELQRLGWERIVAFQTRNPMHRAHYELTRRAAESVNANLLVQPVVGMTKPGDVDHYTRVRCYQALFANYPPDSAKLALLPLAMRMGGPREAVWHAIIRKNFGCSHFIVGRDHAGPGSDSAGRPFYEPYAAQQLLGSVQAELGIRMLPFNMMVYVEEMLNYVPDTDVPKGMRVLNISGTELRRRLAHGKEIPEWFTFPEVERELRRSYPPREKQGFTVFFTGLSGAGKSTIASALMVKLLECGGRQVSLLDGDHVRKHLSSELGFSKEHRDLNIKRIGYVASEITKNGGAAICAPIAPYDSVRKEVQHMIEECGGFVLVHVATPLEICEERDRKGLYAKARAGLVQHFTGISDPYDIPTDAHVTIDTTRSTPEQATEILLDYLAEQGFIKRAEPQVQQPLEWATTANEAA